QATKDDTVLRALVDELERSKANLELEDLERPYFIEYALADGNRTSISASLGAVTGRHTNRARRLRCDVRVASYKLDNTNFRGEGYGGWFGGFYSETPIPIEDDYTAIRQAIWWTTDRKYKEVIETFEKKKAFMEAKVIEDKPDDFSQETPTVHFDPPAVLSVPAQPAEDLAITISQVFREYPDIQKSTVSVEVAARNQYVINTEGTRLRTARSHCALSVNASVQAEDGMELSDSLSAHALTFEGLPPREELLQDCREMIEQLLKVKEAPKLESYTGPVLFDAPAAAAIFAQRFASRFAGGQRALGSQSEPDDLANKLHKRILPRFIDVIDDPTRAELEGEPVMGHYLYDDQGVAARPVKLVEKGKLNALLMSRNPSKDFAHSTGHGRGSYRVNTQPGCLIMTADGGVDEATLRQELSDACEDEDLEYGIRVASLGKAGESDGFARFSYGFDFDDYGGRDRGGTMPLVMYKGFPDGREEAVRGAEFAQINPKAFKRVLAAGNELYVANKGGAEGRTVATPALLFEELDLAKIDRDFDKPPVLPSPLAR
ncbi:MAG: hypothetical protein KJ749_03370, partial [Planctomycetes bacterium]|nr:hypothetical protein [Planctomycetota bacterium]